MQRINREEENVPMAGVSWGISIKFCEGLEKKFTSALPTPGQDQYRRVPGHRLADFGTRARTGKLGSRECTTAEKLHKLAALQREVDEKRVSLVASKQMFDAGRNSEPTTIAKMKRHLKEKPLDGILLSFPSPMSSQDHNWSFPGHATGQQSTPTLPAVQLSANTVANESSERFLKPAQLPKEREKGKRER